MKLEFRFRLLIHTAIYLTGFTAPWNYVLHFDSIRTWQWAAAWLSRSGLVAFSACTIAVLVLGALIAFAAALLRTWAAAYLGASIVQSAAMHGDRIVAAGPYRRTRNPLYLGIFLHTFALALLMPPTGAIFSILAIGLFELRLIAAEESLPHRQARRRVPRLPRQSPAHPPSPHPAHPAVHSQAALAHRSPRRALLLGSLSLLRHPRLELQRPPHHPGHPHLARRLHHRPRLPRTT